MCLFTWRLLGGWCLHTGMREGHRTQLPSLRLWWKCSMSEWCLCLRRERLRLGGKVFVRDRSRSDVVVARVQHDHEGSCSYQCAGEINWWVWGHLTHVLG